MIKPAGFHLRKWGADHGDVVKSVFLQTRGIYLIHAHVTHEDDYEWEDAELIDHLIVAAHITSTCKIGLEGVGCLIAYLLDY